MILNINVSKCNAVVILKGRVINKSEMCVQRFEDLNLSLIKFFMYKNLDYSLLAFHWDKHHHLQAESIINTH